jgi:hypothetical protein
MTNDRVACHGNQDKYIQRNLANVFIELSNAVHSNGKRNVKSRLFIFEFNCNNSRALSERRRFHRALYDYLQRIASASKRPLESTVRSEFANQLDFH